MRNAFQQFLWSQLSLSSGWYLQNLQRKVLSPQCLWHRTPSSWLQLLRGLSFRRVRWTASWGTRVASCVAPVGHRGIPCMRGEFTLLYDLFCEISSVKHAVNMITVLSHGRSRWYNWDCCKCPINGLFLPILVRLLDITLLCNYINYICMAVRSASDFSSTLSR